MATASTSTVDSSQTMMEMLKSVSGSFPQMRRDACPMRRSVPWSGCQWRRCSHGRRFQHQNAPPWNTPFSGRTVACSARNCRRWFLFYDNFLFSTNVICNNMTNYKKNFFSNSTGTEEVDFDALFPLMTCEVESDEERMELKETFKIFDRDGDGYITAEELKNVLEDLGDPVSDEEVLAILTSTDNDKDGLISFEDFQAVWTSCCVTKHEASVSSKSKFSKKTASPSSPAL
ncbi:Calmodulin [Trichinella pseudospiralis]|uniref:Calmodulin n=1 Tax=Trichinella pseudospiralis TaxID=6337 RepID=A0A0V1JAU0_TRIPS|nr:Calmodulin [Trichinella pseudospiralis]